jgi:bifunctional non-homologous end joining protein LigD
VAHPILKRCKRQSSLGVVRSFSMRSTFCILMERTFAIGPLTERRRLLKKLIGNAPGSSIQFSEEYVGNADALFRACGELKLEGIVSKLANSRYQSGRSNTWLKTKCSTESVLTLVGIDRDRQNASTPRALLAKTDGESLDYAGAAFIALPNHAREVLSAKMKELAAESPSIPSSQS